MPEKVKVCLTALSVFDIIVKQKKEGLHRPHLALRLRGSESWLSVCAESCVRTVIFRPFFMFVLPFGGA